MTEGCETALPSAALQNFASPLVRQLPLFSNRVGQHLKTSKHTVMSDSKMASIFAMQHATTTDNHPGESSGQSMCLTAPRTWSKQDICCRTSEVRFSSLAERTPKMAQNQLIRVSAVSRSFQRFWVTGARESHKVNQKAVAIGGKIDLLLFFPKQI